MAILERKLIGNLVSRKHVGSGRQFGQMRNKVKLSANTVSEN